MIWLNLNNIKATNCYITNQDVESIFELIKHGSKVEVLIYITDNMISKFLNSMGSHIYL